MCEISFENQKSLLAVGCCPPRSPLWWNSSVSETVSTVQQATSKAKTSFFQRYDHTNRSCSSSKWKPAAYPKDTMPTNKKKKSAPGAAARAAAAAAADQQATKRANGSSNKSNDEGINFTTASFTNGQLTMLVFLSIGLTKISEIRKLISEQDEYIASAAGASDKDNTATEAELKICKSYFQNESMCYDSNDDDDTVSLSSLLQMKYFTSLSMTFIVLSLCYSTWNTETMLLQVNRLLCLFPISILMVALYMNLQNDQLKYGRVQQNILMCITLLTVQYALPTPPATTPSGADGTAAATTPATPLTHFTKINPYSTFRTLQGFCLLTFAVASLVEVYHLYLKPTYINSDSNNLIHNEPILHGWIVDQLSMAVMYLFVLMKFPNPAQRTFCMAISILKFIEYYYMLPNMKLLSEPASTGAGFEERIYHTTMGTAVFGLIAWFTPPLVWKK